MHVITRSSGHKCGYPVKVKFFRGGAHLGIRSMQVFSQLRELLFFPRRDVSALQHYLQQYNLRSSMHAYFWMKGDNTHGEEFLIQGNNAMHERA